MKRKKSKKEIYEDLLKDYRPTVRSFLLEILKIKLFNLQKGKQPVIPSGAVWVPEEDRLKDLPLKYIALVSKDGLVLEMIRINEETAGHLLKKSVKLVPFDPKSEIVKKGMWYTEGKFNTKAQNEKKN
jgi:hypothetical protein